MTERHEATITIPHSLLVEILQTRIMLPDGVSMTDMTWVWEQDALRIRLVGDSLPYASEGSFLPNMWISRTNLRTGYWWLEADVDA